MTTSRYLPLALVLLVVTLAGCDAWTSKPDPPATQILDIRVEPNPVVAGETTTFTVVHTDSTETGFSYYWGGVDNGVETVEPRYVWTANVEPGEYSPSVQVSREGTYEDVGTSFTVTVVASE
jgi:hypothetical protein